MQLDKNRISPGSKNWIPFFFHLHQQGELKIGYKLKGYNIIKDLGKMAGVSLNPDTPIKTILKDLKDIDLVLIMSVFPGFGGQKFMPEVLKKIDELNQLRTKNNFNYKIEVDGGIDFTNSKKTIEAGADILVSGTTIFKENDGDLKKNIEILRNS